MNLCKTHEHWWSSTLAQVQGSSWDDKMAFKFKTDFLIETPKGTSCYYLDPFLFDNPYFTSVARCNRY